MKKQHIKNIQGFSLIEIMVVTLIVAIIITGSYLILSSGQSAWYTTEANIQLEENLRNAINKISRELGESGADFNDVIQVTINNGAGVNGTDIIRFSMPIVCEAGGSVINATGDVANWGAPLTWGCQDSSCMDADDDCLTVDYRFVEYRIDASNQLVRRILDPVLVLVREDVLGLNITDFQATFDNPADPSSVTLVVTGQITSDSNRTISTTKNADVFFRNKNS